MASAALFSAASPVFAQEVQPPADPETETEAPVADDEAWDEEVIVVRAERGDQSRIDRRVYSLGDDPISQSSTMLDVLQRVPSVTVAPSGAVRLLGSENVTIQVDGQPVPGATLDQVLRSLSGSEVERIEVITNPSAQFSAAGDGGIINIVTRSNYRLGLTGATTAAVDSLGGYQLNVAPTWSQGAWSYGFRAGANGNAWEGGYTRDREEFASGNIETDRGTWEGDGTGFNGGAVVNYRPNDRRRASFNLNGWSFDNSTGSEQLRALNGTPQYTQTVGSDGGFRGGRASFDFQQTGEAADVLKVNVYLAPFSYEQDNSAVQVAPDGTVTRRYVSPTSEDSLSGSIKLDYERPLGEGELMTMGGQLEMDEEEVQTALTTLEGVPFTPDYSSSLRGRENINAVYGTYQFRVGNWTALPGVRVEHYRREVRSGGGETDDASVDAFPSLHVRRNLGEGLDFDVSYSRRIERPDMEDLDPALRFWETNRASSGNPNLEPTMTNAYEANLVYQTDEKTFNITLYNRLSEDIFSQLTDVQPDGLILTRPVNAGESAQRGAQVIMRAPIARGWRYSVSANLLSREFDVLSQGVTSRREEVEYSGNAQVEYRDRSQSDVGADHVQFELQFQGPQYFLQGERDEFVTANVTWRRRLSDRLSGVLTVQDVFDSQNRVSELRTDQFFERSEQQGVGTRVRFALTYQFGSPQQGPPPDAGMGGGGGPDMGGGGPPT